MDTKISEKWLIDILYTSIKRPQGRYILQKSLQKVFLYYFVNFCLEKILI